MASISLILYEKIIKWRMEEKRIYKIYFQAFFCFGKLSVGRMYDASCSATSREEAESIFWRDIRLGKQQEVNNNPLTGGVRIVRIEEVIEERE